MPQPGPQAFAIEKHRVSELFYGGAVGGGKSDYLLGDFAQDVPRHGAAWRGILFRRSYGELEELIARSMEVYPPWFPGVKWNTGDKVWAWPNGATLKLRYMEHSDDWLRYWGHQYTWIGWDELPSWPNLNSYHKLKARLRSAHGVPNKRVRATGNPGGPSHNSVKEYFRIDECPKGDTVFLDEDSGMTRMYVKSRLQDNKILMENDPGYVSRLRSVGSEALVRAWLEGDWNAVEGQFFDKWSDRLILQPQALPADWIRFRSMDWGFATPFSLGWWAIAMEPLKFQSVNGKIVEPPRGSIIRYREWYGAKGANKGLRKDAYEVGRDIIKREKGEKIRYGVLDPSAFATSSGPSIAEELAKAGAMFRRADNRRVGPLGALSGWSQMRTRINQGMIYCFDTCADSIRTIPVLPHDKDKPEDLDTDAEDHAADDWRYACMSRPIAAKPEKAAEDPWTPKPVTFHDMMNANRDRREREKRRL